MTMAASPSTWARPASLGTKFRSPSRSTTRGEIAIGPIDDPVLHSPSVVNVGNPHCLFFVDDVEAHDLARFGPMLEHHPLFPERANISLVQVLGPDAFEAAHLGARRRADAGLRHGRLRRRCRRRAARACGPQSEGEPAGRRSR